MTRAAAFTSIAEGEDRREIARLTGLLHTALGDVPLQYQISAVLNLLALQIALGVRPELQLALVTGLSGVLLDSIESVWAEYPERRPVTVPGMVGRG